ncbi:MAG: hypothetical protein JNK15_01495 [Planctomycetes bacterium]|nr:hypothetical protein [Planctomycetota bacterium]
MAFQPGVNAFGAITSGGVDGLFLQAGIVESGGCLLDLLTLSNGVWLVAQRLIVWRRRAVPSAASRAERRAAVRSGRGVDAVAGGSRAAVGSGQVRDPA